MRPQLVDPRLLRHASAARGYLVTAVAAGLAGTGLILAQAGLLAHVLAGAATGTGVAALAAPLIALAAVLAGRAVTGWGAEVTALRAAATVKSQLRRALTGRALRMNPGSPQLAAAPATTTGASTTGASTTGASTTGASTTGASTTGGELATLATRGLDGLDAYFARYLPQLVLAGLVPLAVLIRVAVADWLSAVIIAVTLPLVPVFAVLVGLSTRARTRRQWALLARLGGHFLDVVAGLPTLLVFGRARAQREAIASITDRYRTATMATLRVAFLSALVLELAATLATALVAVEVGLRLLAGHLGYETALVVLLLTPEAFVPLRNASAQFHASIEGVTAAGKVLDILDGPDEPCRGAVPTARKITLDLSRQTISLNDVSVVYPGRTEPALSGVTLRIAPGEHLIVTGLSGAGKSTLLSLLLRFTELAGGTIEVAGPGALGLSGTGLAGTGAGLADIPPSAWREQLAWVPQRPHLFDDTVAANIALGRPGASQDQIREAARLAGADRFISGLEAGYQTPVGERGLRLSSGQRQKIALARAFLRDAPLLLLDEPAAHLDPFSASEVADAIAALADGRTVVHVTHGYPAGLAGGRVIRLDEGRLVTVPAGLAGLP